LPLGDRVLAHSGPEGLIELIIALLLILLNGLFALSELAVVSARRPRLRTMAEQGRSGAQAALHLAEEPGRFLSTVQIGITLVGILAGAFSGAALSQRFDAILEGWGVSTRVAEPLAYTIVIGSITYLSVIIGELVPKHVALRNPEGIACAVAPMMAIVSRVASPAVWFLDASTKAIFKLFGSKTEPESQVTDEEIRSLVAEAESAGVIEPEEKRMIAGVMRLADRPVRGLMTPRTDVDLIDLSDDEDTIRAALVSTIHSRVPVVDGDDDNIIGVVQVRAVLADLVDGKPLNVRTHLRNAPVVPDTLDALDVLTYLREAEIPMALVHDEYGHFEGIVTPVDGLLAITGEFTSREEEEPPIVEREDGSWLVSGWMQADEVADMIGLTLPAGRRDYQTVAGFVLSRLRHIPTIGEFVEALGWRFEVVDIDGRRIDKVLITKVSSADAAELHRRASLRAAGS
jgi:magnesium and cobalt exporter, CNNM family